MTKSLAVILRRWAIFPIPGEAITPASLLVIWVFGLALVEVFTSSSPRIYVCATAAASTPEATIATAAASKGDGLGLIITYSCLGARVQIGHANGAAVSVGEVESFTPRADDSLHYVCGFQCPQRLRISDHVIYCLLLPCGVFRYDRHSAFDCFGYFR